VDDFLDGSEKVVECAEDYDSDQSEKFDFGGTVEEFEFRKTGFPQAEGHRFRRLRSWNVVLGQKWGNVLRV